MRRTSQKKRVLARGDSAVLYLRVSTKDQTKNQSLPTQEVFCRKYCADRGWSILKVFQESASAKSLERYELQEMLEYCRKHRDVRVVVVFSISRASRELTDYYALKAELRSLGIELVSANETIEDTAVGEFHEAVLAANAQFENRQRSARTELGMRHVATHGYWPFKPPVGFLPTVDSQGRKNFKTRFPGGSRNQGSFRTICRRFLVALGRCAAP